MSRYQTDTAATPARASNLVACSVDGCDMEAKTRSWCQTHYMRWWRTGNPTQPITRPTKRLPPWWKKSTG